MKNLLTKWIVGLILVMMLAFFIGIRIGQSSLIQEKQYGCYLSITDSKGGIK